jgi:hypothetical protein
MSVVILLPELSKLLRSCSALLRFYSQTNASRRSPGIGRRPKSHSHQRLSSVTSAYPHGQQYVLSLFTLPMPTNVLVLWGCVRQHSSPRYPYLEVILPRFPRFQPTTISCRGFFRPLPPLDHRQYLGRPHIHLLTQTIARPVPIMNCPYRSRQRPYPSRNG